jgi:septal ring factor EnvC (AmiA/AmiB activator)
LTLEWVSVFLVGVVLGLSVATLVVLWRVWGTTHRTELDGRERLEILREEREVLLAELERLREQKERLRWLREGRAALLAELKRLRSLVDEEAKRADEALARLSRATPHAPNEAAPPVELRRGAGAKGTAARRPRGGPAFPRGRRTGRS